MLVDEAQNLKRTAAHHAQVSTDEVSDFVNEERGMATILSRTLVGTMGVWDTVETGKIWRGCGGPRAAGSAIMACRSMAAFVPAWRIVA